MRVIKREERKQSGIALFMVLAAMSILSILVIEFTYITQLNQKIAYNSMDQLKTHYLAKSALKISLLRLKAYKTVKDLVGKNNFGGIPKHTVEQIWNFPLIFPFPSSLPGMTSSQNDTINKFNDESGLEGNFSAVIESESSKFNLNLLLASYIPEVEKKQDPKKKDPQKQPDPNKPPEDNTFDPVAARRLLGDHIQRVLNHEIETNEDLAEQFRDVRIDDLVDNIAGWVDSNFQSYSFNQSDLQPKKMPFFSVSELHMLPEFTDKIYEVLAPTFTAGATPGININTIKEATLRALIPAMTDEEVKDFFEYRDQPPTQHLFKDADDFFGYLKDNVSTFSGDEEEVKSFRKELEKQGLIIVTDESYFKITIEANLNQTNRLIEAYVKFEEKSKTPQGTQQTPFGVSPAQSQFGKPNSGLTITFMRFL